MDIAVVEEKENPFFKRKDMKLSVKHLGSPTPSKSEIVKELATKYNVGESQVKIDYIFSKRGIGESFVSVKILEEKPKEVTKEFPKEKSEVAEQIEEPKGETVETQTG